MLKLLLNVSVILLLVVFVSTTPRVVQAHPLDQTHTQLYMVTDEDHKTLPANTGKLMVYISWQQASYIHETGENGANDPEPDYKLDAFDMHMKKIYAEPQKHRDFILKNLEIKAQDQLCKISDLNEAKYDREEVLIGEGVQITGKVECPVPLENGVSIINRMFYEDFPYQSHEVEIYLYARLVSQGRVDKNNEMWQYPTPSPSPAIVQETKQASSPKKGYYILSLIVLLSAAIFLGKKKVVKV